MAHATTGETTGGLGRMSSDMQSCIEACTDCHRVCLEAVQSCLRMGGAHARPEHIGLLLDCAQICATSADFMSRGSHLHTVTCSACAEICRACAESCRQLGGPEMQACAEECDRCADSCARMAGSGGRSH